jgi:AsmA protein
LRRPPTRLTLGPVGTQRRIGRALLWGATVVALLIAAGGLVLVLGADRLTDRAVAKLLPRASEALGREVTVEQARLRLLPVAVRLKGLRVAGEGEGPPLLVVEEAHATLSLWRLLRSWGSEVEITGIALRRPEVAVVRRLDGTWSLPEPASAQPRAQREVEIRELRVDEGRLRLIERQGEVSFERISVRARDLSRTEPFTVRLSGAFAHDEQNVDAEFKVQLRAGAQAGWPRVDGMASLSGARLLALREFLPARLGQLVTAGRVSVDLQLRTARDGSVRLSGQGRSEKLRLREEPVAASVDFQGVVPHQDPAGTTLELTRLALEGPRIKLAGTAAVAARPRAVRFDLHGPLLDLDGVLGSADPSEGPQQASAPSPSLPPSTRAAIQAVTVKGKLEIDRVVSGRLELGQVRAEGVLQEGVFTLSRGAAEVYGGRAVVDGTQVDLRPQVPQWHLRARLDGLALETATQALAGARTLVGRLSGTLDVRGAGAQWAHVREALTGAARLRVDDGALITAQLGPAVTSALSEALRRAGQPGVAKAADLGHTPLRDVQAFARIQGGWLVLDRPMVLQTPQGRVELGGRLALDQRLDLRGTFTPSEQLWQQAAPRAPPALRQLSFPLALGGTLREPSVQVDAQGVPKKAAEAVKEQAIDAAKREVENQARRRGRGLLERFGVPPR